MYKGRTFLCMVSGNSNVRKDLRRPPNKVWSTIVYNDGYERSPLPTFVFPFKLMITVASGSWELDVSVIRLSLCRAIWKHIAIVRTLCTGRADGMTRHLHKLCHQLRNVTRCGPGNLSRPNSLIEQYARCVAESFISAGDFLPLDEIFKQ